MVVVVTLGSEIKRLRLARRMPNGKPWTQQYLAERAGLDQTTISGIERDEPLQRTLDTIKGLALALDEPPEYFGRLAGLESSAEGKPASDDPLELLFAEMRRRPEVRRAIERGSEGLEGEDLAEFLTLTAGAWASNLYMQTETRLKERERAERKSR